MWRADWSKTFSVNTDHGVRIEQMQFSVIQSAVHVFMNICSIIWKQNQNQDFIKIVLKALTMYHDIREIYSLSVYIRAYCF